MLNLVETKFFSKKMPDGQLRLLGKYGFIFKWFDKTLAVCIESTKVNRLTKKLLQIPGSALHVMGDSESIVVIPVSSLLEAHKVLKLKRKSSTHKVKDQSSKITN